MDFNLLGSYGSLTDFQASWRLVISIIMQATLSRADDPRRGGRLNPVSGKA